METTETVQQFIGLLSTAINEGHFIKITLSKVSDKSSTLQNIYGRLIELQGEIHMSFTFRHKTQDITKNHTIGEAIQLITDWLGNDFLNADLFTTQADHMLKFNKKRKARLLQKKPSQQNQPSLKHNQEKKRFIIASESPYLHPLGIANAKGEVLKSGQRKFRQINKYIEIIDSLIKQQQLPDEPHIVDMGSGKGYLTFALYDYLKNQLNLNPSIIGIELRQNLVAFCKEVAAHNGFDQLGFIAKDILDYNPERIDMLIALHACDIATDIAIAKGIMAEASIIVVAPCCHKQVRKQMNCTTEMQAILQHGIMEERQAELITDGIRALLLEANGYKTRVFEFISTEHTSKNLMITALKAKPNPGALAKVAAIKQQFGIEYHYLEKLLEEWK